MTRNYDFPEDRVNRSLGLPMTQEMYKNLPYVNMCPMCRHDPGIMGNEHIQQDGGHKEKRSTYKCRKCEGVWSVTWKLTKYEIKEKSAITK